MICTMKKRMRGLGLLLAVVMLLAALPFGVTVNAADEDKIVVACCGDSLTVSYMSTGGKTYPNQLRKLLGSRYTVRAYGVNGSTASTTANFNGNPSGYSLQKEYEKSIKVNPDVVVLALGSNDAKVTNWEQDKGVQFEKDYRALIASYQALESHPLVILGISPEVQIEGDDHNAILNKYVNKVNEIQRKVAAELNLPTVDIHGVLQGRDDLFDKDGENSGGDGCHPNNSGYAEVALAVSKVVRTYAGHADDPALVDFTVNGGESHIDTETGVVSAIVPYASKMTFAPNVTVPVGAAITPDPSTEQDFSKPITYTVTAPDGKTTKEYTIRAAMASQVKVACVGDSITYGGFPKNLQALVGESYEVKNFGENSTTVSKNGKKETGDGRGAYIYHNVYKKSLAYQPDVVFILLGSNDSKVAGNNPDWVTNWTDENKANFKADLTELVQSYRDLESHPQVIIVTPTKPYSDSWGVNDRNIQKGIIPLEREVATEMNCKFIDLYTLFKGHTDWLGGDQLHPNEKGNEQIAAAYSEALRPLRLNVAAAPTGITITRKPSDNEVVQGSDFADYLSVCKVGLTYSNGTVTEVPLTADMITMPDMTRTGMQTLTVTYQGFTTTLDIRVLGCGDVDGDGEISTADAVLVLQYAAKLIGPEAVDIRVADVDKSGAIDTADAVLVLQYAAKLIDKLY